MSYLDKLKENTLFEGYTIVDEANTNYNNKTIIYKELGGTLYQDSQILNVQLVAYSDNIEETKSVLDAFSKTYNATEILDGLDYIRQYFNSPVVISNFNVAQTNRVSQIYVYGTLIISSNVSDIKDVYIDGSKYFTTTRNLVYTATPDNQKTGMLGTLNSTEINQATIQFNCSLLSKGDDLNEKIDNILESNLKVNTGFKIKLVKTNGKILEYENMKMVSYSLNSQNSSFPIITINLMK